MIFGSDRWGLFEDKQVEPGAVVYLYESLAHSKGRPKVTHLASYVRMYRHEDLGTEERKRRPPTTDGLREGMFVSIGRYATSASWILRKSFLFGT